MSRPPSDATKFKRLNSRFRRTAADLEKVLRERDGYRNQAAVLSAEVTDWKRRFDALLKIVPESERGCARGKA